MAYRKINYTPETLERRKAYQRNYARAKRRTPEGLQYSIEAWAKTNAKVSDEEKKKQYRDDTFRHRAKKLGVCPDAVQELIKQGCEICGKKHLGLGRRTIVLDHNHQTGKFRGILCSGCNTAIGQFKDDPKLVERALRYLLGEL
jgi:hypothetical protein